MLKTLRRDQQLTQAQLAKQARVSQPYIVRLEDGTKTNPSLTVLRRLAKALGVTTAELLDALAVHPRRRGR